MCSSDLYLRNGFTNFEDDPEIYDDGELGYTPRDGRQGRAIRAVEVNIWQDCQDRVWQSKGHDAAEGGVRESGIYREKKVDNTCEEEEDRYMQKFGHCRDDSRHFKSVNTIEYICPHTPTPVKCTATLSKFLISSGPLLHQRRG